MSHTIEMQQFGRSNSSFGCVVITFFWYLLAAPWAHLDQMAWPMWPWQL